MARIKITGPDGKTITLNAPDDATPDQINAKLAEIKSQWGGGAQQAEQTDKPGRIESGVRGALQGLTFGFGDEIAGAAYGAADFVQGKGYNYSKNRDEVRAANDAAREANPGTYLLGEIGGGVALPFGVARTAASMPAAVQTAARAAGFVPEAMKAATFGQRVGQGARMGATYGAAYGAGNSEADSALGVAQDTGEGALAGGLLGGAAVPAIDTIAAVGRGVAAPFRSVINPKGVAAEKVAEAMARDAKEGRALAIRAEAATAADPSTMIADVGGRSNKRLIRAALNQQSKGTEPFMQKLDSRKAFEGKKIERSLRDGLRLGADDFYGSVDEVTAKLSDIGQQGFKPALAVETEMTPALASVLKRPLAKRVLAEVETSMANAGKAGGFETRTEALHRVKMELNRLISTSEKAVKMGQDNGWNLNDLRTIRRDLLNAWDNKAYKSASRLYADEASLRTAAEKGYDDFMQMPWQEVRKVVGEMSRAERTMFRRGAVQAITERIGQGSPLGDKVRGVMSPDNMMQRLRPLFDDQKEWRRFQRRLVVFARQTGTRQAAQGNSTSVQQAADMMDSGRIAEGANTLANAATGNWKAVLDAAGRYGNRFIGMTPRVAEEVLRIQGTMPSKYPMSVQAAGAVYTPELAAAQARMGGAQQRRDVFTQGIVRALLSQQ
jgi:hypothetical protein